MSSKPPGHAPTAAPSASPPAPGPPAPATSRQDPATTSPTPAHSPPTTTETNDDRHLHARPGPPGPCQRRSRPRPRPDHRRAPGQEVAMLTTERHRFAEDYAERSEEHTSELQSRGQLV